MRGPLFADHYLPAITVSIAQSPGDLRLQLSQWPLLRNQFISWHVVTLGSLAMLRRGCEYHCSTSGPTPICAILYMQRTLIETFGNPYFSHQAPSNTPRQFLLQCLLFPCSCYIMWNFECFESLSSVLSAIAIEIFADLMITFLMIYNGSESQTFSDPLSGTFSDPSRCNFDC